MRSRTTVLFLVLVAILAGCGRGTVPLVEAPSMGESATPAATPTPCVLDPIAVPTPPAETPGYTELDPATGLHMTGTPTEVDLASYRLEIRGMVDSPLSLTYDDLRCMPRIERQCTLTCPGFFQDEATWAGASLDYVLELAQVQAGATGLRLISADGYETIVPLLDLSTRHDFLAYEWEGEPLPILHGFPVRAVFPSLNGNKWVKWLVEIDVY